MISTNSIALFAAATHEIHPVPVSPGRLPILLLPDLLLIIAVGVVLMIGLIFWAIFIRKPKQSSSSGQTNYRGSIIEDPIAAMQSPRRVRKKHKRRRREHRSRNPTLSETGGLPPPRTETADPIP